MFHCWKNHHQGHFYTVLLWNPVFSFLVRESKRHKQGGAASLLQIQLQNLGELLSSVAALATCLHKSLKVVCAVAVCRVNAERIPFFGCKPRGNRKWQLSCLLPADCGGWRGHVAQRASYLHKQARVLGRGQGGPINPPRLSVCAHCPLNLFLSLHFHFLSSLQLYHSSVIPHSNTGKHTMAENTQLSILKCYRRKQCQILTLTTSDPVRFFSSVFIFSFKNSPHRQVWDGALPVWGSVCGRLSRGLLPHPGEKLPALFWSLPPLHECHPLPQV